jgi:hypothetical protein
MNASVSSTTVITGRVRIRPAVPSEQKELEALQWRASLTNAGDRDALLANPDAIALPLEQMAPGGVLSRSGTVRSPDFRLCSLGRTERLNWTPCLSSRR